MGFKRKNTGLGGKMKNFWKRPKREARSWEDITTPKSNEITEENDDVSENCGECGNKADNVEVDCSNNLGKSDDADFKKDKKTSKKTAKKSDKIIENLVFDPTVYYGWGEDKVDASMQKLTKIWNVIASVLWFLFGSITFAPVLFMANKIDKFFDDKKKSFLISLSIYVIVLVIFVVIIFF